MVSWPQGAVVAAPSPFPDFFLAFLRIFQNYSCTLGEKRIFFILLRVYVCVKAKLIFVSFFSFFLHISLIYIVYCIYHTSPMLNYIIIYNCHLFSNLGNLVSKQLPILRFWIRSYHIFTLGCSLYSQIFVLYNVFNCSMF